MFVFDRVNNHNETKESNGDRYRCIYLDKMTTDENVKYAHNEQNARTDLLCVDMSMCVSE